MPLQNPWVTYFTRSYEQIKASVLTALGTNIPEITDHTESDPIVKEVSIWAGIAEMLGYYIDNIGREAYLPVLRLKSSAKYTAAQLDYRIHAMVAASVDLTFILDIPAISNFVIPVGTVVGTLDATPFVTVDNATILAGDTTVNVAAYQRTGTVSSTSFTSPGGAYQSYVLPTGISDSQVTVKVNGVTWLPQQTFAYSLSTDKHYVQTVNVDDLPVICFGDGVMGAMPGAGASVIVIFYITLGAAGNVGPGMITEFQSTIVSPGSSTLTVTNAANAAGGTDNESLESLRKRIPLSLRVMDRAVTRQDYIDNAELVIGVAKAGVVYECGKWVDIYVIPAGGGIASNLLLNDVATFLDPRRMITTQVRVFPAGEVLTQLYIDLKVIYGYDPTLTSQAVRDALTTYLSYLNQEIAGGLFLSDLYQVIEAVEGVDHSIIQSALFQPYAHKEPPTTLTLNWNRFPTSAATLAEWRLVAISSTQFHLFRSNAFLQTVTVGVPTITYGLVFTILPAAYNTGDAWTWWSYPTDLTITGGTQLQEPSIFTATNNTIIITLI